MRRILTATCRVAALVTLAAVTTPSKAQFFFSTNDPDGLMATGARIASPGKITIETGDDFILTGHTRILHATFTGLLINGATLGDIGNVNVDLYHVFPLDSDTVRIPNVPTRTNSPADTEFTGRDAASGGLSFVASTLNSSFTANNSVLNGIHPFPLQTTGGEGPVTGSETFFDVFFSVPFDLPAGHYFFVPTVEVNGSGDFLWLSAPKPIVPPGTPFSPDLQSWIRDENLDPDWLRIGTDVVGHAPAFNAAFSLSGTPEPSTLALFGIGVALLAAGRLRRKRA